MNAVDSVFEYGGRRQATNQLFRSSGAVTEPFLKAKLLANRRPA